MNWKTAILIVTPLVMLLASCKPDSDITAHGKCPKCGINVKGGLVKWNGMKTDGQPAGGIAYKAECESCNLPLFSKDAPDAATRKINWQTLGSKDSNKPLQNTSQ